MGPASTTVGKKWFDEKTFPVLEVPSTIVPVESNFVLNPLHPDFSLLEIGAPQEIFFDLRIANLMRKAEG